MNNNNVTPIRAKREEQAITALVVQLHRLDARIGELLTAKDELRFLRRERQQVQNALDQLVEHRKERVK
jgi:hypothetical protein